MKIAFRGARNSLMRKADQKLGIADQRFSTTVFSASAGRTDPAIKETEEAAHWGVWCVLIIFPLAAIAHNAIFYSGTCMLNPFGSDYSDWPTLKAWLSRDPSLPWAIGCSFMIYYFGQKNPMLRVLAKSLGTIRRESQVSIPGKTVSALAISG